MRKLLVAVALAAGLAGPALAQKQILTISRVSSTDQRLNVHVENGLLSSLVRSLQIHLSKPVRLEPGADRVVNFRANAVSAEAALRAIVEGEALTIESRSGWWVIADPKEPAVSLDVKDVEVELILRSMKEQCGIRNLIIDPDVKPQRGTFLFYEVPCTLAFRVVFESLGLSAQMYPNSVVNVEPRP